MYTKRATSIEQPIISDFNFYVKPLTVTFQTPYQNQIALTLEKGMQTIGSIDQTISISKKLTPVNDKIVYKFKQRKEITFRISNDKNLEYQWTVYEIIDGGQYNQIDSVSFNLTKFWKDYYKDFHNKYSHLSSKLKEKEQVKIVDVWKEVNEQTTNKNQESNTHVAYMKNANIKLEFEIYAKGELDEALQLSEVQKQVKRRQSLQRSQLRSSMMFNNNEEKNKRLHDKDFKTPDSPKKSNLLTVSFQPELKKNQTHMINIQEDASEQKSEQKAQRQELRDSVGELTLLRINTAEDQNILPDQNPNSKFPQQHLKSQSLKKIVETHYHSETPAVPKENKVVPVLKQKKSSVKSNSKSQNKSLGIASKGVSRVEQGQVQHIFDGQGQGGVQPYGEDEDRSSNLKISSKIQASTNQENSHQQQNSKLKHAKSIIIYIIIGAIMLFLLLQLMGHSSKVPSRVGK